MFVNVHVTVSPAATTNVAVAPVPVLLLSSHKIDVRSQPAGTVSVEVYVPGPRLLTVMLWPSLIEPAASPVKVKLPAVWSGSVSFLTMIVPRARFV